MTRLYIMTIAGSTEKEVDQDNKLFYQRNVKCNYLTKPLET